MLIIISNYIAIEKFVKISPRAFYCGDGRHTCRRKRHKKITALCDEVEELLKNHEEHTQKDIEFHTAIALIETHREITDAIASHDPLRAQDAMYLHLVYNRKRIQMIEK